MNLWVKLTNLYETIFKGKLWIHSMFVLVSLWLVTDNIIWLLLLLVYEILITLQHWLHNPTSIIRNLALVFTRGATFDFVL